MALFRKRWWFLGLCCFTYMCAYLCRVNLSTALGKMEAALEVSSATLGLLGTAYFFFYAFSQLVSGFFGDRVRPERLVSLGLVGVVAVNVGISFSNSFQTILTLWCLNGVFQSMLWGPMSRLLAGRFDRSERVTVSTCYSLSMPAAYILSWSVIAPALADCPWTVSFRVPGAAIMLPMALWLCIAAAGAKDPSMTPVSREKASLRVLLATMREDRLWFGALACLCDGVLKESFTIWAPMILTRLLNVNVRQSALYLVLLPLSNAAMIALNARVIQKKGVSLRRSMVALFILVAACAALLMAGVDSVILTVVLMALISGCGYACNNVLMGILPMGYADRNITSTLVGVLDFSAYIGAGVAAYGLGLLITGSDIRPIALVWLTAAVVAAASAALGRGQMAERAKKSGD